MLCDADSGRDKKRQKFNSKPDEKIGSSNLHLEVKNEDDHVLKLVSTLETIGEASYYYFYLITCNDVFSSLNSLDFKFDYANFD